MFQALNNSISKKDRCELFFEDDELPKVLRIFQRKLVKKHCDEPLKQPKFVRNMQFFQFLA